MLPEAPQRTEPKRIDFTAPERQLVEEAFSTFAQTVQIIARLNGVPANELPTVQVTPDRSGILYGAAPMAAPNGAPAAPRHQPKAPKPVPEKRS